MWSTWCKTPIVTKKFIVHAAAIITRTPRTVNLVEPKQPDPRLLRLRLCCWWPQLYLFHVEHKAGNQRNHRKYRQHRTNCAVRLFRFLLCYQSMLFVDLTSYDKTFFNCHHSNSFSPLSMNRKRLSHQLRHHTYCRDRRTRGERHTTKRLKCWACTCTCTQGLKIMHEHCLLVELSGVQTARGYSTNTKMICVIVTFLLSRPYLSPVKHVRPGKDTDTIWFTHFVLVCRHV